jgi:hypothetical protein
MALPAKANSPEPEEPATKLRNVIDSHLSKLPADEQARRWDALEAYVNKFSSVDALAKR